MATTCHSLKASKATASPRPNSPSLEQIREACRVIQSRWTESERLSRRMDYSGFARLHARLEGPDVVSLRAKTASLAVRQMIGVARLAWR
jgi:hypothetical protein